MTQRKRVLVIAEAANPEWVSVPLVGWSMSAALREVADVHIVTQIRNRDAILRAGLVEGKDFTAIDSEALSRPLWRLSELLRMGKGKGWTTVAALSALAYPYFEHLVWRRFGAAIERGEFDVVHRVTPLSPAISSPIAPRCARAGVAFVLGPLNGGVPWPAGFDAERRREREWLSYVRGAYKLLPGRNTTLRATRLIIAGSRHAESEIPDAFRDKCVYMAENGIDPARFTTVANHRVDGPLRACFVGRLVPYKGPDILLDAAAPLLRRGEMTLDIIGDGPLGPDLRARVEQQGLGAMVRFHGWVDHKAVQERLAASEILAFPSVREFGGGVVLEAMAVGVVPVVIDYGGPGELVDDMVGYKIPIGSKSEVTANFGALLQQVVAERGGLAAKGEAARARVMAEHLWARKADRIATLYGTLDKSSDRARTVL